MDVLDGVILASTGMLAVFFASVAVLEWWYARAESRRSAQRLDARVLQHSQRDRRVNPAA